MKYGFLEETKDKALYMSVPRFIEIGGISHGFTTRLGGVSEGEFSSLNIGIRRPDKKEHIMENLRRACSAVGATFENLVISHQVHGTSVRVVTMEDAGEGARGETETPEADALITNVPGIPLLAYYADCVPVALYDPVKRAIGAVHAGWKGTVQEIAKVTVEKMMKEYGSDPRDMVAAIGASIGPCCFEIDRDVAEHFPQEFVRPGKKEGKFYADLWEYNKKQLTDCGILPENITISGECTVCHSEKYFSNRAQKGKMGNHGLIMELKE